MEMGGGQAAIFPQRTTRIGKKETFRLILSSGLDCFSQRQELVAPAAPRTANAGN